MKASEYLEPDIGEKGETNMNKRKVIYVEAPGSISKEIAEGEVIDDFLPPPEELVRKEPKVKITITLNSVCPQSRLLCGQTLHFLA
jgi:hypothetical protein